MIATANQIIIKQVFDELQYNREQYPESIDKTRHDIYSMTITFNYVRKAVVETMKIL